MPWQIMQFFAALTSGSPLAIFLVWGDYGLRIPALQRRAEGKREGGREEGGRMERGKREEEGTGEARGMKREKMRRRGGKRRESCPFCSAVSPRFCLKRCGPKAKRITVLTKRVQVFHSAGHFGCCEDGCRLLVCSGMSRSWCTRFVAYWSKLQCGFSSGTSIGCGSGRGALLSSRTSRGPCGIERWLVRISWQPGFMTWTQVSAGNLDDWCIPCQICSRGRGRWLSIFGVAITVGTASLRRTGTHQTVGA